MAKFWHRHNFHYVLQKCISVSQTVFLMNVSQSVMKAYYSPKTIRESFKQSRSLKRKTKGPRLSPWEQSGFYTYSLSYHPPRWQSSHQLLSVRREAVWCPPSRTTSWEVVGVSGHQGLHQGGGNPTQKHSHLEGTSQVLITWVKVIWALVPSH